MTARNAISELGRKESSVLEEPAGLPQLREGDVLPAFRLVFLPAAVRFGWADYPVINLWNKDGFPASPFQTAGE